MDEHQDRTAEYLDLTRQLRKQHDEETRTISEKADAVIYLSRPVGGKADQAFLREFNEAMGGMRAMVMNAIGVMGMVDRDMDRLLKRHDLCARLASQFRNELNTVIPVSAALGRALDLWQKDKYRYLKSLREALIDLSEDDIDFLLSDPGIFDTHPLEHTKRLSGIDRRHLHKGIPWSVFTLTARTITSQELENAITKLQEYSGFDALHEVMEKRFFQRSQILRCFRMINDAYSIVDRLMRTDFQQYLYEQRKIEETRTRFHRFLRSVHDDHGVAQDILQFINEHLPESRPPDALKNHLDNILMRLDIHRRNLISYNEDFCCLMSLEKITEKFSEDERNELRKLFGRDGLEAECRVPEGKFIHGFISERQRFWRGADHTSRRQSMQQLICKRADTKYGELLFELAERANTHHT